MTFRLTQESLSSNSELWKDGYLAFGFGLVEPSAQKLAAALKYFGPQHVATSMSGFPQELLITERALHGVDLHSAPHMLVSLLQEELRMFSTRSFEMKYLNDLATLFFQEMGECEVYTNMSTSSTGLDTCRLCSWTPVTTHARDFFLFAINDRQLGYWLYTDDE